MFLRNIRRIGFLAIFLTILFTSCKSGIKKEVVGKGNAPIPVSATIIKANEIPNVIFLTGSILPNEKVELRSEISGRITGIFFKEGQQVRQGQLLVKLYDLDLKPQLEKLKLLQSQAQKELERKKKVYEINGISAEEYELAENQVRTMESDVQIISSSLSKTSVIAPFSGVVGLRNVSVGEFVSPTTIMATLQQINPVKIEFDVPEKYGEFVKVGSSVSFATTDASINHTAKVYAIEQMVDMGTRTFKVRAHASNAKSILKPGAFVKLKLTLGSNKEAIQVPTESLIASLKGQQVFLYKNGFALARLVKPGIRNESVIQINDGLQMNDTVITSGIIQLKDSTKVKLTNIK